MSLITGSLRDVLSIKLKCRDDNYTDQFSRIFMVKMFIISSIVMSFDYFSDKVNCIVPKHSALSRDFVHSVCWIQGFYVYKELENRISESGYYGIPKDIEFDGITKEGKLCRRINKASHLLDPKCKPMTKVFFLQFQYFPFYIASLAILYYMPYILFRMVNSDLISLKGNLKEPSKKIVDARKIVDNYFQYCRNGGKTRLRLKILLNIVIKCTYVFSSVLSFCVTNILLNGNYKTYGIKWLNWTKLNNSHAYDFSIQQTSPKPGNVLLPSMGFCEIMEGSNDIRSTFTDQNKFICEISPNVLYQYILIVLWYLFMISITIAIIGVLAYCISTVLVSLVGFSYFCDKKKDDLENICKRMTFREIEYLRFIRTKDLTTYGDVVRILQKQYYQNYDGHLEFETEETVCKDNFLTDHNSISNPPYHLDKL